MEQLMGKWKDFWRTPQRIFLVLLILSLGVSVYALRQNNQQMIGLRGAVYEADKKGGDIEGALAELRTFVHGHMNTNLSSGEGAIKPAIQLKYTYERLVTAEQAKVDAINSKIYSDAQNYCQAQNPSSFSGGPRVPCVEEYVTTHGAKAVTIADSLYKFDFVSPSWSPDLAGWSIVLTIALLVLLITSFTIDRTVKAQIKG
ncbi:hypothetical protein A2884_01645 [Candidatus Saccharibacteria bacterium RIFCSPHIGHO2_01_FULL_48_12]|nr:MAG: hypothetical protein A2884_01645 [Candidatus Saccharibacteria bacterium RIFCSPHIGHO2_01_FULL_48_12]